MDSIIFAGRRVRTTPQFEALPWGRRVEGVVESTDGRVACINLGGEKGKENLSHDWIMRVPDALLV